MQGEELPKVSIIIPCYNQGLYIEEAIESALNQSYSNIEIYCVNDGSRDNSAKIIKDYINKYNNIYFINFEKNQGVINARNTAIKECSGKYILPLDADDTIKSSYVEKAAKILNTTPDIGVVYCKYKHFGISNKKADIPKITKQYLLYSCCVSACSMFRKSDFLKIGGYKDYMSDGNEDWDLWLRFYEQGFKFQLIDDYMLNYRRINNLSRTKKSKDFDTKLKKQLIRKHLELYLNDNDFIDKVFLDFNIRKKYLKYKKLFNILALLSFVELFILITQTFILWG